MNRYAAIARKENFRRYKRILSDKRLRALALQGLLLREVERDPASAMQRKKVILDGWHLQGLWIAEAVQMGVIDTMDTYLNGRGLPEAERARQVQEFFNHIEERSIFVASSDNIQALQPRVLHRLDVVKPIHLLIAGAGEAQRVTAKLLEQARADASVHYDCVPMPRSETAAALFMLRTDVARRDYAPF